MKPVLEGKQLLGHDSESWMCMSKETLDYNKNHDDVTLWTNSMFGGMPTYMITMQQPNNLVKYVEDILKVFPITIFFILLYFLGFYILMLNFRLNPWLAIVGSIAFTFASYNLIIIGAGHNTKAVTIAYMAPLIGSIYLTFKDKKIIGSILTAFFLSLAIRANHIQILYYTLIVVLFFGVVELTYSIKEKQLKTFIQSLGLSLAAAVLALGMNATSLLTTAEYSKYTMRGDSNGLTIDEQSTQKGLNKDYITQWSYGIDETMTVLIPNYKGGASGGKLDKDSHTAQAIAKLFGRGNIEKIMDSLRFNTYWGTQPGTSGPVYLGAIVMLLFVSGLFILDKRLLWWLIPMIILTTMLSWGRNFQWLTDIFIDYVPLYNKFRTVSMTLVAAGFGVTLIALLTLKEFLNKDADIKKMRRALIIGASITGGIALIFAIIPSLAGSFASESDLMMAQQYSSAYQADFSFLTETLQLDRKAMLQSDAIRSLIFILLAATSILLYWKGVYKQGIAIAIFGVLMLKDLMPVAKRYLNDDNFGKARNINNLIKPTEADKYILSDKTQFRVLNLTTNIFNDASPSYFHKNIGGYHAAKLRRYQELINIHLSGEIEKFTRIRSFEQFDSLAQKLNVLNMLNLKYIIIDPNSMPLTNPYANGNAWFVSNLVLVNSADEEMIKLGEINSKTDVVVDKSQLTEQLRTGQQSEGDYIRLAYYQPNHLKYEFNSKTDQLAVFSEIFYDKGWNAYINGEKVPYVRANYLLRAMQLKAGNYNIEFKFEPASYNLGNIIALIASLLLICFTVIYIVKHCRPQSHKIVKK
ncbi:YfhO family protein [Paludibacter sp.]